MPRKAFFAALGGNDRGQLAVLEPIEEPPQFGSDDGFIGNASKQRINRVEHDTPCTHPLHRVIKSNEQSLEIVIAGLMHRLAINRDIVGGKHVALFELGQIETKRGHVHAQVANPFIE